MRSMFTPVPFAKFDLGDHGLGRKGVGAYPVRSQAIWPFGGTAGYGAALGQMEDPYLTQAERDQLLMEIQAAVKLVRPLEDMIAWSGDNDPQLKNYLGSDWSRFFALSNSIAPLYPTVSEIADRMAQTDAEYWYRPRAVELADVKQWTTGITEMYKILQAHKTPAKALAPGTKPPPVLAPTAVTTMPKGGVLTSMGGLSTKEYLIGGAVAVGLGALIYALVG